MRPAAAAAAGPGCAAMSGCASSPSVTLPAPGAAMAGSGSVRASADGRRGGDGGSAGRVIDAGGSRRWPAPGTRRGRDGGRSKRAVWSWAVRSAGAGWSCVDASALTASSTLSICCITGSGSTRGGRGRPALGPCVSPRARRGSGGTWLSSAIWPTPRAQTRRRDPCRDRSAHSALPKQPVSLVVTKRLRSACSSGWACAGGGDARSRQLSTAKLLSAGG